MTTTEYKDNEYMLHTGNPALRNEWKFNSRISYTWTRNNLSLMPYIQNNGKTRTMYEKSITQKNMACSFPEKKTVDSASRNNTV